MLSQFWALSRSILMLLKGIWNNWYGHTFNLWFSPIQWALHVSENFARAITNNPGAPFFLPLLLLLLLLLFSPLFFALLFSPLTQDTSVASSLTLVLVSQLLSLSLPKISDYREKPSAKNFFLYWYCMSLSWMHLLLLHLSLVYLFI